MECLTDGTALDRGEAHPSRGRSGTVLRSATIKVLAHLTPGVLVPDPRENPQPDDRRLVELSERAIDNVGVTPAVGVPSMNLATNQAAEGGGEDIDA